MDYKTSATQRKSYIEVGEIFFWTATINNWQNLLLNDAYKKVIVDSLDYLVKAGKIDVFAFVIMPNHIHLIWRIKEMNGKETPQGSFLKFTAHEFKKMLKKENAGMLNSYAVTAANKKYEFWQRDSLAIHLYNQEIAYQKLDYIHYNPLAGNWLLVNDPCDYTFSTAKFYMLGTREFSFIKDLRQEF